MTFGFQILDLKDHFSASLNQEFISTLDFCTNKANTQGVFVCAPTLTESNNHVCFENSPYQEWYKVKEGKVVLYNSPRACTQAN